MAYDPDEIDEGEDAVGLADLFTDRVPESKAFAAALAAHRWRLDDAEAPSPQGRNVLVFHGLGGLGKSELSRRLQAWVNGNLPADADWGQAPSTRVDATARIDLHGTQGHIDGARHLAELRVQLGGLKERWPIFDVAFAAYWASTHKSAELPVVGTDGQASFVDPTLEVLRDLAEDLESPATIAGLGVRVVKWLVGGITARFAQKLAVTAPRGYDDLFLRLTTEPTPDDPKPELLGRLAGLLRWELDHSSAPPPLVVTFIDTFERLDLDHRREGESLLNRVAWAMPSVLFVVTGRNRVTWWELDGPSLHRRGPVDWPLLVHGATEEPRQHALEYLSEGDRRLLLRRIRDELDLSMTDEVLEAIAEQSGGLPEYIRLAKEAALTRKNNGVEITADAVTGSLEDLVLRLFEDVPSEQEQAAIRAAALFPQCTPSLVAASAGVSEGTARRALSRPLFDLVDADEELYTMHDRVRAAIRDAQPRTHAGWTDSDWRSAGTRALVHLRAERGAAKDRYDAAVAVDDRTASAASAVDVLRMTGLAVTAVCEVDATAETVETPAYPDWLTEALVKGPTIAGLRPFVPGTSRTARGRDILDFIEAKSLGVPLQQRVELMRRLLDESPTLGWIAGRHLAYALANASEWDASIAVFDELLRLKPGNDFIVYQRALRLYTARRYGQLRATIPSLTEDRHAGVRARLRLAHGDPDAWLRWTLDRVADRRQADIIKDALEIEGIAVRWHALTSGGIPDLEASSLRERADTIGHDAAGRDAVVASALIDGRIADIDLRWLVSVDRARNEGEIGFREATVRSALAFAADDRASLAELHRELEGRRQSRGNNWVPVDFLLESRGLMLEDPPGTEWIDDRDVVAARWAAIWERWRDRVTAR